MRILNHNRSRIAIAERQKRLRVEEEYGRTGRKCGNLQHCQTSFRNMLNALLVWCQTGGFYNETSKHSKYADAWGPLISHRKGGSEQARPAKHSFRLRHVCDH